MNKLDSNNTLEKQHGILALMGDFLQRKVQATNAQVSNYVDDLLIIMGNNYINLTNVTEDEIIGVQVLSSACKALQYDDLSAIELDCESILVYQLLKSISLHDKKLLTYIKPLDCSFVDHTKVCATLHSEIFTYNLIKKLVKTECLKEEFESEFTVNNSNLVILTAEMTSRVLSKFVQHSRILQRSYGDFYSRLINNKLTIYSTYLLLTSVTGNLTFESMQGNRYDIFRIKNECEAIGNFINEMIMWCLCLNRNVVELYMDYCDNVYKAIIYNNIAESKPSIPTTVDLEIAKLQREIKQLRLDIYALKSKQKDELTEVDNSEEEDLFIESEKNEELKASEVININDKLNIIKNLSLAIVTSVPLDEKLSECCTIINSEQLKGKNIGKNYDYLVKLTKNMPHSVAYAIKSEIEGNSVKLITTSRTNINLLLDSIIEQI